MSSMEGDKRFLLAALSIPEAARSDVQRKIAKLLLDCAPPLKDIVPRTKLLTAAVKAQDVALVRSVLELGPPAPERDPDEFVSGSHRGPLRTGRDVGPGRRLQRAVDRGWSLREHRNHEDSAGCQVEALFRRPSCARTP